MRDLINQLNSPLHQEPKKPKKTKKSKDSTKYDIDYQSSTSVDKQIEYFKWLERNNLKDTHKNREDYDPSK